MTVTKGKVTSASSGISVRVGTCGRTSCETIVVTIISLSLACEVEVRHLDPELMCLPNGID